MCGRVNQSHARLKKLYPDKVPDDLMDEYNIGVGGFTFIEIQSLTLDIMQFGLTPFWAKKKMYFFNARIEGKLNKENDRSYQGDLGIFKMPAFRDSIKYRRAVLPVDSFIEGPAKERLSKPYLILDNNTSSPNAAPFQPTQRIVPQITGNVIFVPLTAQAGFAAGHNNPLTNNDLEVWTLPFLKYQAYCFEISGDSMYRTLRHQEKVFVEQQDIRGMSEIRSGYVHVIELKTGDYLIKRVYRSTDPEYIQIASDNPDHKDKQTDYHLPTEINRIWKVKDALKWDLGFMEDMSDIDDDMERAAYKLDQEGKER